MSSPPESSSKSKLPLPIGPGLIKNPFKMMMASSQKSSQMTTSDISNVASAPRRSPTSPSNQHQLRRSSSLRRPRNKDKDQLCDNSARSNFSRSGTGGSLERHRRSGSQRRFRDRDLNVRVSRGVQTRLTKDPFQAGFNSR